jgi:hypothetical protein
MPVVAEYEADVAAIVARRHDLGGDYWTTPDRRLVKGAPFSTVDCVTYLLELGVEPDEPVVAGALGLILDTWQDDGRFRLYPNQTPQPCHTANALKTLCRAGLVSDDRVQATLAHLLDSQWEDAGWRCSRFPYGHGPQTEHSNPHPTLMALDAFRHSAYLNNESRLDDTVGFLLNHWATRAPIGPCMYGIGTLFMQPEFPFRSYNLFYWLYVLSFYDRAKDDPRFHAAFNAMTATLSNGHVVVERVVPKLAKLSFCAKGKPSKLATRRYREILTNLSLD